MSLYIHIPFFSFIQDFVKQYKTLGGDLKLKNEDLYSSK